MDLSGKKARFVLGAALLGLTAFKQIWIVVLSQEQGTSCLGWCLLKLKKLHMDWESGIVLEGRRVLRWV